MTLLSFFDRSLLGREDRPALEWLGTTLTFGDVEARSNRMAHALADRGFEKGDRLCAQLANSADLIVLFLACVKLGVMFVPINVLYRERERSHIIADAEPRETIGPADLPPIVAAAEAFPSSRPAVRIEADDPCAIIYTSGTTGASKGVVLSHANFAANALNLIEAWQITSDDRLLLCLPLFHVHGLANGLHSWLGSGCRMRLLERFDHRTAAHELESFRPTLFFGVPTMYVRLLEVPEDVCRRIGASARLFVSGSAPLPAHVFDAFRALRAQHPGALRDDRDAHDHQQSSSRRAAGGNGGDAVPRCFRAYRGRRAARAWTERLLSLLASARFQTYRKGRAFNMR